VDHATNVVHGAGVARGGNLVGPRLSGVAGGAVTPYYDEGGVVIYHGETLQVLGDLDRKFDALVTDPPYSSGGQFRGDRIASTVTKYVQSGTLIDRPDFAGDNRDQRSYLAWCSLWLAAALTGSRAGAACAIFSDWRQLPTMTDAVQAGGWVWRGIGVWDKTEGSRPRTGGLRAQCEYVVWGTAGSIEDGRNDVALPGVWRGTAPKDKQHIAEKPLELLGWLVQLAPPDGVILDPFIGSGTTLVAAKNLAGAMSWVRLDDLLPHHRSRR
jgi:site-specific DNA-methyltransferase (adenine-specific)